MRSVRRTVLAAAAALGATAPAALAAPTHYVEVPGGARIALNVKVPAHCLDNPCPAFFEFSGYESGSDEGQTPLGHLADDTGIPFPLQTGTRAAHAARAGIDQRFVTVLGSVRGTGCSSGEFDIFSWQSALDGKAIIDGWIAQQQWSNGEVVIFGHSYSGLTGMMVASTRPVHLKAVSASGLFGDVYRDVVYPGGVTNYGFPLLWTGGVRPLYDVGGGTIGGLYPVEDTSDECAANQAERSRTITQEPLVQGLDDTDGEWYRARSLISMVGLINVPTHVTTAYQDEQTGGRGPTHVFDHLSDSISKRLVMTNGDHGTQTEDHVWKDRVAWMDYWMRGVDDADLGVRTGFVTGLASVFGPRGSARTTSRTILGYQGGGVAVGEIASNGYPLGQTQWKNYFAGSGGALTETVGAAGSANWLNGSRRQAYSYQAGKNEGAQFSSPTGPDEVELSSAPFTSATTVAGPVTANLFVASTAPDTELFLQVLDRAPDGKLLYLNRGMLRGSHRAVAPGQSESFAGHIYRPWRPHDGRELVVPGTVTEYLLDVNPFGHVFLPGHRLVVKLHAPPLDDNDYNYVPKTLAGVNTLHFGAATPSRITLPTIPAAAVGAITAPVGGPCAYYEMRCVQGPAPAPATTSSRAVAPRRSLR